MAVQVRAREVSKVFGSTWAVRAATLELEAGECVVIEGANGSGKSTLLGMLGRMVRPTSGTVEYMGEGGDDPIGGRARLGWVSHEAWVYPDLTAEQNVGMVASIHGLDVPQAWGEAVKRFELRDFGSRPVRTYSRGQRQRVALACALVHRPPVLLLDEPTTGLDRRATGRFVALLAEELERGTAIAVVSHEVSVLERVPTRRVRMDRGRILRAEPPAAGAQP